MATKGYEVIYKDGRKIIKGTGSYPLRCVKDLKELVNGAAERYGSKNAFKYKADGRVVTKSYIDLKNDVDALGTALYELDLNGASIAIIGENRYEWGTAYFSVINGLGRGIPLDKHLPAAEIVNLIKRSKAEAIFFSKRYLSVMKELSETDAGLKIFICFDDYTEAECFKGLYRMSGLIERGRELLKNGNDDFISLKIDREAPCILLFTSGTTSASKGVLLCHRNIAANVTSISGFIDVKPDDVALSVLPLHHTFENTAGMMFMIHSGVCIAYCEGIRHIAANLREFDITWMIGVPAIFEAILKQINDGIKKSGAEKKVKFLSGFANFLLKLGIDARSTVMSPVRNKFAPKMRFMASGAASIDKETVIAYENMGIKFLQGYGLTETSPLVLATMPGKRLYGTVGHPIANVSVTIDNPDTNGMGELLVKGENVMLGYFENKEATDETFTDDGWLKTGDLAKFDDNDAVIITGRAKSMIVFQNGKKAFPEEYEFLLNRIDGVKDSFAWGHRESDGDVRMCAKLVTDNPGPELADYIEKEIKKLNNNIPQYKMLRYFILSEKPIIRSTTLKIKRGEEQKRIDGYLSENGLTMRAANKTVINC